MTTQPLVLQAHRVQRDISRLELYHPDSLTNVTSRGSDSVKCPHLFSLSAGWPWGKPILSPNLGFLLCEISPPLPLTHWCVVPELSLLGISWSSAALRYPEQRKNRAQI